MDFSHKNKNNRNNNLKRGHLPSHNQTGYVWQQIYIMESLVSGLAMGYCQKHI